MISLDFLRGRRVGVVGLGRSGLAVLHALRAAGIGGVAWDDCEAARAGAEGFELARLDVPGACDGLSMLVISPGVPHLYPAPHPAAVAALAAGVPLDNDIGLLFAGLGRLPAGRRPRVVAVTGTNGKSTTAELIGHVLRHAGRPARVAGNVGRPVFALDPLEPAETLVLELSSYQTELARCLAPDLAVLLNLSDDHLDRHGGRGGYYAAKERLFTIGAPRVAVVGIRESEGRFLAGRLEGLPRRRMVALGPPDTVGGYAHAVAHTETECTAMRKGVRKEEIRDLPAGIDPQNIAAAFAVSRALGVGRCQCGAALASFPGLPHRQELLGRAAGVAYVNDSKATNAAATARALAAVGRVRWIVGGRAKAGGIQDLEGYFPRIAKAYLIGETAEDFARTLGATPHEVAGTLESAAARAFAEARPGETVLLSPACASFDQFSDYEARGEAFRQLVAGHLADAGGETAGA